MADTDEKGREMSACSGCGSIVSHEWKCGACAAKERESLQKELDRLRQALQLFWTRWKAYEHLSEKEQLEIAVLVGERGGPGEHCQADEVER